MKLYGATIGYSWAIFGQFHEKVGNNGELLAIKGVPRQKLIAFRQLGIHLCYLNKTIWVISKTGIQISIYHVIFLHGVKAAVPLQLLKLFIRDSRLP